MAEVLGAADPLVVSRRADDGVLADGIVRGVVKVVGPVAVFSRRWLAGDGPTVVVSLAENALGGEDSEEFRFWDRILGFDNEEIDQIVDERKAVALKEIDGDSPVEITRLDERASFGNIGRIGIEAQGEEWLLLSDCREEFAAITTDMNEESALEVCLVQNLSDLIRHRELGGWNVRSIQNGRQGQQKSLFAGPVAFHGDSPAFVGRTKVCRLTQI